MTDQQEAQPRKHTKPTRRAWIMRGIVTPVFGLLAVACIVFGALNSTIWKPDASVTAAADARDTQYVVVDPGVLDLVDKSVVVGVEGGHDGQDAESQDRDQTCIALGSAKDVAGWLSGQPYVRVTGLKTWTELSTSAQAAQGQASASQQQVAFADSDMWTKTACGQGSATMTLADARPTDVAVVDMGSKVADATIDMHWVRQDVPDFALPWYFGGGLCAVLAVLSASVFAMDPEARRKMLRRAPSDAKQEPEPETTTIGAALAGTIATLKPSRPRKDKDDERPRRRHARHAGAAEDESRPSAPTVVDPTSRNLVAEQARHAQAEGPADAAGAAPAGPASAASEEPTSVIPEDELQAYFARLAQEVGVGPADPQARGDVAAREPSEPSDEDGRSAADAPRDAKESDR